MSLNQPEKPDGRERVRDLIDSAQRQTLRSPGPPPRGDSSGPRIHDNLDHGSQFEFENVLARELRGYRLLGQVHRGGQGVVFRARQLSTGRDVAIKVMRQGPFAARSERMRFEREVQILGKLRHADIVTIHDSGTAAGHFYLVTDFVEGVPLDRFIADRGRETRQTVNLFERICAAVNAAHLHGVTHRDLKPANILVDSNGKPQVLDFGLAKMDGPQGERAVSPDAEAPRSDDSIDGAQSFGNFTVAGQFIGSIPWCSPEQAAGAPIDIRTDVYSLGVLLYHALTGRFPYFTSGPLDVVLAAVRNATPIPPRTVRSDLDDDLSTILLKCLEKEPEQRYQSAGELARELSRWARGEPIEAKRYSSGYWLKLMLRRHWLVAGLSAASLVLIVGALVAMSMLWRVARHERDSAELAAEKARTVTNFISEMLGSADPVIARGRDFTIREMLAAAQRDVDSGRFANDAGIESTLRATLGRTYASLSRFSEASEQLVAAIATIEKLKGPVHADLVTPLAELARVRRKQGALAESEALARRALTIAEATHGPNAVEVAGPLGALAFTLRERAVAQEAESLLKRRLDLMKTALGDNHPDVIIAMVDLAQCAASHEESIALLDGALLAAHRRIPENHPAYVRIFRATAHHKLMMRDYAEAEAAFLEALRRAREIFGEDSTEVQTILSDLAMQYDFERRTYDLLRTLDESTRIARRIFGDESVEVAQCLYDQCAALGKAQRMDEGEQAANAALKILNHLRDPDVRLGTVIRAWLVDRAIERQDWPKATTLAGEILAIDAAQLQPFIWPHGAAKSALGVVRAAGGDIDEAEALLLEGIGDIGDNRLARGRRRVAIQRLVDFYESIGQSENAGRWRAQLETSQ